MLIPIATTDLIECHLGAGKHVQAVVQDHPGNISDFLKVLSLTIDVILHQLTFCS